MTPARPNDKLEDTPRIERLIALAERLILALESDIAELKKGRTATLKTNDPEVQKLTALYGREAQNFDPRIAQSAPPSLRQRFLAITARFRDVLQMHARMIARVKNASEGIIRAIATEVERANAPTRPYGPRPGTAPKSSGAMLFNKVV
ncbi:MAG TPA: hypothetical protein VH189_06055 [Rhizomicrobium sp.]|jgi:hypothetical protein|nr:hypothetical protein [Rhizomicrobium sp.]